MMCTSQRMLEGNQVREDIGWGRGVACGPYVEDKCG